MPIIISKTILLNGDDKDCNRKQGMKTKDWTVIFETTAKDFYFEISREITIEIRAPHHS